MYLLLGKGEIVKISVIIPTYNAEKHIEKCVNSVLSQEINDLELIIVNDGSTDGTYRICQNLKDRDSRIVVVNQQNQGVAYSRRKGHSIATGDYCIYIDSDDYWDNDFFSNIQEYLIDGSFDVIMFRYKRISDSGKIMYTQPTIFDDKKVFHENKKKICIELAKGTELNNLVTKIFKRNLLQYTDYPFFYSISNGEDLLEVLTIINNANKIIYLDSAFYNYHYTENSLSTSFNIYFYRNMNVVRNEVKNFIINNTNNYESIKTIFLKNYLNQTLMYVSTLYSMSIDKERKLEVTKEIKNEKLYVEALGHSIDLSFKKKIILFLFNNDMNYCLTVLGTLRYGLRKIKHRIN